jgi:hypothetical protein
MPSAEPGVVSDAGADVTEGFLVPILFGISQNVLSGCAQRFPEFKLILRIKEYECKVNWLVNIPRSVRVGKR